MFGRQELGIITQKLAMHTHTNTQIRKWNKTIENSNSFFMFAGMKQISL